MSSVSLINGHDDEVMTIQDAIAIFKEDLKDGKCSDDCPECNARELAISALEKQVPKEPIVPFPNLYYELVCPTCGSRIYGADRSVKVKHCKDCGQAFKWEEE